MAHGFLEHFYPQHTIYSAGIETHGLNRYAVEVMAESGIDIRKHTSNLVDEYKDITFGLVLTVCDHANESCPYFFNEGLKEHQNFSDPSKKDGHANSDLNDYRKVRDEIRDFCKSLGL